MNILWWIVGGVLCLSGLYVIVMNWLVFVNNVILKKKWVSTVPFIGVILVFVGMAVLPIENIWKWAWFLLFVDWGSIPLIVLSLLHNRKEESEQ